MKFKKYIEIAEEVAGSQANLARHLDIDSAILRKCKNEKQGLPDALCIQVAQLIKMDKLEVIAASNLVTEKNPVRRKIFEGCLATLTSIAFAMLLATNSSTSEAKLMLQNNATHTLPIQFIQYK